MNICLSSGDFVYDMYVFLQFFSLISLLADGDVYMVECGKIKQRLCNINLDFTNIILLMNYVSLYASINKI